MRTNIDIVDQQPAKAMKAMGVKTRREVLHKALRFCKLGFWRADLVLAEALQGCDSKREFDPVNRFLSVLPVTTIRSEAIAIQAARNHCTLVSAMDV